MQPYIRQLLLSFLLMPFVSLVAQTTSPVQYPEVGKPCPDFTIRNIQHYTRTQGSLKDFRGKWLILDFWNQYCGACVASFPRSNQMQKEFGDKVQFMLVGYNGSAVMNNGPDDQAIRTMYEKFRKRENLELPVAYDSLLFSRFDIYGCPHIIILDDKGIVRAITNTLRSEHIREFLAGKQPVLPNAYWTWHEPRDKEIPFDRSKPLLRSGNGGNDSDFIYRSVLAKWDPPTMKQVVVGRMYEGRLFQVAGTSLQELYTFAFTGYDRPEDSLYGLYYPNPILAIKDSAAFRPDYLAGKNVFCYSEILPENKGSIPFLMRNMQRDLENYFGYEAKLETRKMPYLRLICLENGCERLKTKGETTWGELSHTGFSLRNCPIKDVIGILREYFQTGPPILDETNITQNIDLKVDAFLTDFMELRTALRKNGLDIVKGEKEMKVVVISDPVSTR